MSSGNRSAVPMAIDLGRHSAHVSRRQRALGEGANWPLSQVGAALPEEGAGPAVSEPSATLGRGDGARPLNGFLTELRREKRRADRSRVALSMVLYRVDDGEVAASTRADQFVEMLHSSKRETDILGHVGGDRIAVLCPDTDEEGIKGFMRKVEGQAGKIAFTAVAATYPDDLFENLAKGERTPPSFELFLAADPADQGSHGYHLKRSLDIAGALLAICLLGPLMLLVAAAVALTSPGPIIFKQTRVGKGGFPFTFYKFRSMQVNVDDRIHREFVASLIRGGQPEGHATEGKPATYKLKSDPRVTRIGRFIRKTSLDELPQLFNVLKGDMSLVGPRPPLPYEAAEYQAWHLRRVVSVKPGITGIWQVEGRSQVPFAEMVRMDLRYIRECSLMLDLSILFKTVLVVVRGVGAD